MPRSSPSLAAAIAGVARELSASALGALVDRLRRGSPPQAIRDAVPATAYAAAIDRLLVAWASEPQQSGSAVALAIEAVGASRRDAPRTSLVWTGPTTGAVPVRRTDQALLQQRRVAASSSTSSSRPSRPVAGRSPSTGGRSWTVAPVAPIAWGTPSTPGHLLGQTRVAAREVRRLGRAPAARVEREPHGVRAPVQHGARPARHRRRPAGAGRASRGRAHRQRRARARVRLAPAGCEVTCEACLAPPPNPSPINRSRPSRWILRRS